MREVHIRGGFQEDMARAQSGDTSAVECLLQEFAPLIRKYQYIGSRPDADLLSELFLAAYLCVTRFRVDQVDLCQFLADAENNQPG